MDMYGTMISFKEIFTLGTMLTITGLIGIILNRRNFLSVLLAVELTFLGLGLLFIATSVLLSDPKGQIIAFVLLTVAAAESAIGLGLLVVGFRLNKTLTFEAFNKLRNI